MIYDGISSDSMLNYWIRKHYSRLDFHLGLYKLNSMNDKKLVYGLIANIIVNYKLLIVNANSKCKCIYFFRQDFTIHLMFLPEKSMKKIVDK